MDYKPLNLTGYVKRIIVNEWGEEKTGKSHFGLTGPKPLFYMNLDKVSGEDVLPKFVGQMVEARNYWTTEPDKEQGIMVRNRFMADWKEALHDGATRTIVVDTFTELRSLLLLAEYGKTLQVGNKFMYTPIHMHLRQLLNEAYTTPKNLILIHKARPKYVNGEATDILEMSGYSEVPYLVQTNVQTFREPVRSSDKVDYPFGFRIINCSLNGKSDLINLEFVGAICNFQMLACAIFPGTTLEEWT